MPLTESIMLFYGKAFPMSYRVLSVCGLCSNLATMEVSSPLKNGRVSQLSTIAIAERRTFLLFGVQSYCSFSLHLPGHRPVN